MDRDTLQKTLTDARTRRDQAIAQANYLAGEVAAYERLLALEDTPPEAPADAPRRGRPRRANGPADPALQMLDDA
jgi:hypothetical protein